MHYVYKTTNLINGKIYIGIHKSNNIDCDLYLGSGIQIKNAIKKYGKNNFIRLILYSFSTLLEAYKMLAQLVNLQFIKSTDNYNICLGGIGGAPISGRIGMTKQGKFKFILKELTPDYISKGWEFGGTINGKCAITKEEQLKFVPYEYINIMVQNGWEIGRKDSPNLNKVAIIKDSTVKYIFPNELTKFLTDGWIKQGSLSKSKGRIGIHKGLLMKLIPKSLLEDYKHNGWVQGYPDTIKLKLRETKMGVNNPRYGKKWITNLKTGETMSINGDAVPPIGWKYGRGQFGKLKKLFEVPNE